MRISLRNIVLAIGHLIVGAMLRTLLLDAPVVTPSRLKAPHLRRLEGALGRDHRRPPEVPGRTAHALIRALT